MRAFVVLALLVPLRMAAQQGSGGDAFEGAARLRVVASTVPISLDGRLDGLAWASADSISDFRQREPSAGAPASERTVVKVSRDATALYVAVRSHDADMRHVRATTRAATYRFPGRSLARPLNGAFVVKIVHRIAP